MWRSEESTVFSFLFFFSFSSSEKQKSINSFRLPLEVTVCWGDRRCLAIMSSLPPSASKHNTTCHLFVAVTQKRASGFKKHIVCSSACKASHFFPPLNWSNSFIFSVYLVGVWSCAGSKASTLTPSPPPPRRGAIC